MFLFLKFQQSYTVTELCQNSATEDTLVLHETPKIFIGQSSDAITKNGKHVNAPTCTLFIHYTNIEIEAMVQYDIFSNGVLRSSTCENVGFS